ncbi:hypothetical protein FISHEDRAFT_58411 [Fistulina hepatica ATCC 64428]|nr:hypothetical protein FISHEDRAFT_58411 [Fistulina hepatica ATCC 64428]
MKPVRPVWTCRSGRLLTRPVFTLSPDRQRKWASEPRCLVREGRVVALSPQNNVYTAERSGSNPNKRLDCGAKKNRLWKWCACATERGRLMSRDVCGYRRRLGCSQVIGFQYGVPAVSVSERPPAVTGRAFSSLPDPFEHASLHDYVLAPRAEGPLRSQYCFFSFTFETKSEYKVDKNVHKPKGPNTRLRDSGRLEWIEPRSPETHVRSNTASHLSGYCGYYAEHIVNALDSGVPASSRAARAFTVTLVRIQEKSSPLFTWNGCFESPRSANRGQTIAIDIVTMDMNVFTDAEVMQQLEIANTSTSVWRVVVFTAGFPRSGFPNSQRRAGFAPVFLA